MRRKRSVSAKAQTALLELSQRLLAAKDEHAVVECAVEIAASALGTDHSTLVLANADGRLITCAVRGWPADFVGHSQVGRGKASLAGYTVLRGRPIVVADYAHETRFTVPSVVFEHSIVSGVSAPMIFEGTVVGALLVHSRTRRRFGEDEVQLLSLIANQSAVALDKVRLLAAEHRRADELDALRATVADILSEVEVPGLFQKILARAVALLDATGGELGLYEAARKEILIVASHNMGKDYADTRLQLGEGAMGQVAETGESLIVQEYENWAGRSPQYAQVPWHAVMAAPLFAAGRLVGAIGVVDTRTQRQFADSDLRLLNLFAQQAALALERARLFEDKVRRAQEAETLRQATTVVAAALHQDEAIELILHQLARVVPYDSASVQLLVEDPARPDETYLEIVGGRGWRDPAAVIGLRFPVPGDNPNSIVIQRREPYILDDAPSDYAPFRADPHSHIHSWLGAPLIVRERVIGMLAVDSQQSHFFDAHHARLVAAFADQVAIAIENARLFEAEMHRRQTTAALLEISQVASSSLEVKQVLKQIAQRTAQACRAHRCTIFLLDAAGEYLEPVMSQFRDGHTDLEQWRAFQATTADRVDAVPLFHSVIRERRPALVDDTLHSDRIRPKWTQPFGIRKLLVVPLVSQDRAIGLMALDHTEESRTFTPDQIDLALTIGGQAAASIQNARLFAEAQQRAAEMNALRQTALDLVSHLESQPLLETIVRRATDLLGCAGGVIYQWEEVTQQLRCVISYSLSYDYTNVTLKPGQGMAGRVYQTGKPLIVNDYAHWDGRAKHLRDIPSRAVICVPILWHNRVMGTINVNDESGIRIFDDHDVELLSLFANQAAIAMENARLFEEVQRLAVTDSLTGLANRRALEERLEEELRRAQRYHHLLSVLMIDIDHFKQYNDTHGHPAGDLILQRIARLVRAQVRETDSVARYGGEEFIVLLPETPQASALDVAEKIRAAIAATAFPQAETQPGGKLTISLGAATWLGQIADARDLIRQADDALYRAKRAGRNCVCGAG